MSWANAKRFFESSGFETTDGGFAVTLDGRTINTPGGAPFTVPQEGVASAVAAEWAAQGKTIHPETMPFTGFCCSVIDIVVGGRTAVVDQLVKYAESDLLCYRADAPEDLRDHQQAHWQPLLDWVRDTYGARLTVTSGVLPADQSPEAIAKIRHVVEGLDDFQLTVLASVTQAAGSLVIGLCVIAGRLNADEAYQTSQLDETWQNEKWGEDSEDAKRLTALKEEIRDAVQFLDLVRSGEGP